MELVRTKEEQLKTQINRLESLEYELVKHLLLYGKEEGISTEKILVADENNQLKEQEVQRKLKVHEKIFLELQQDEIELSTPDFQQIYSEIIAKYHQNPDFEQSTLANELPMELSPKVSEILMSEEKEQLCDWEKRGIVVKPKSETAFFAVDDILLNIRLFLVNKIIFDFQNQVAETISEDEKRDILENIINYMQLRKVLFHRLSRVV
ncbi:DNA primase (fragment) [Capnocytophaga canimorsus]|uniref:DNA primase n=2 Tax=Capnocytophaga canimorsus TaxID=28188 RepID=A0A0B7I816_9FLAO